jgi:hypothetical protein
MEFEVFYKNKQDLIGHSSWEAKLIDKKYMSIWQLKIIVFCEKNQNIRFIVRLWGPLH